MKFKYNPLTIQHLCYRHFSLSIHNEINPGFIPFSLNIFITCSFIPSLKRCILEELNDRGHFCFEMDFWNVVDQNPVEVEAVLNGFNPRGCDGNNMFAFVF